MEDFLKHELLWCRPQTFGLTTDSGCNTNDFHRLSDYCVRGIYAHMQQLALVRSPSAVKKGERAKVSECII